MPPPSHSSAARRGERRTHRPAPPGQFSVLRWALDRVLLVGLCGVLLLGLLAEMPWLSRLVRTRLLQADVVLVYVGIAAAGTAGVRWTSALLRGPCPWVVGLLVWAVLSAARAPYPAFAVAELLRLALGAGVFFAAAFVLRPHETCLLPYPLLGLGVGVGLYGLVEFGILGDSGTGVTNSVFGNHEQLGSFLVLLFPPALALALDREQRTHRLLFAQGAALVLGAALLLARTRSAWAGAAFAMLLLSGLALRYTPVRLNRSNKFLIVGPALIVLVGFVGLLAFSQLAPLVSQRAATLSHALDDSSFSDRLHRWRSACRMASERPVTGWGLGSWPVMEGRWTHQGDDIPEVLGAGTGHSNLAHNFWVQWAAETGGVGLALQIAVLAAFGLAAVRALPRLDRSGRTLLLASVVAVGAGAADMVGAPSYTFPGVSSLLWVWLGLGLAVMREEDAPAPTPFAALAVPGLAGLLAAGVVLGIGDRLRADGQTAPRGTLTVTAQPPGPVAPGTRVLWTATYRDPAGKSLPTAPGTEWRVTDGALTKTSPTFLTSNRDVEHSGWQGNVAPDVSRVTVTASYWDQYSRRYQASLPVAVKPPKSTVEIP